MFNIHNVHGLFSHNTELSCNGAANPNHIQNPVTKPVSQLVFPTVSIISKKCAKTYAVIKTPTKLSPYDKALLQKLQYSLLLIP